MQPRIVWFRYEYAILSSTILSTIIFVFKRRIEGLGYRPLPTRTIFSTSSLPTYFRVCEVTPFLLALLTFNYRGNGDTQ